MKKRILTISTYPIKNPQHGGQKRVSAIVGSYKKFADVRHMAIFSPANYREYSTFDVPLSRASQREANKHPLTSDIVCGQMIMKDQVVKALVTERLRSFNPDIVQVEQPYVYIGIKPLLRELGMSPKIVFSSHNVEGPMKREILEAYDLEEGYINRAVAIINETEHVLSSDADIVAACTEEDVEVHAEQGAKNTILAMNGIAPIITDDQAINNWKIEKKTEDIKKTALFVASAHPPSIVGFDAMIGKGLGFLGPQEKLVVAGGIGDYFTDTYKTSNIDIGDVTFWLRAKSCGRVSEGKLGALLEDAEVILLPITEGGGSNLKTAEAIIANKKIVTTTHALRSFEWAKGMPNVWVADTRMDFVKSVREALDAKFISRNTEQQELAKTVLWDHRLAKLVEGVRAL